MKLHVWENITYKVSKTITQIKQMKVKQSSSRDLYAQSRSLHRVEQIPSQTMNESTSSQRIATVQINHNSASSSRKFMNTNITINGDGNGLSPICE